MSFGKQIQCTTNTAAIKGGFPWFTKRLASVGGPSASKCQLLMSSVNRVLLYGAEIGLMPQQEVFMQSISPCRRLGVLHVTAAHQIVSEPVTAGVFPVHPLAWEWQAINLRIHKAGRECCKWRTQSQFRKLAGRQSREAGGLRAVKPWIKMKYGKSTYLVSCRVTGTSYVK